MNQDPDDKLVSAEYRAVARERTPAELDAAILRQAKAATSRLQDFTALWLRPLAFVATLALSLALLLEWTSSPEFLPDQSPKTDAGSHDAGSEVHRLEAPSTSSAFRKNSDAPAGKEQTAEPAMPADSVRTNNGQAGRTIESDNKPVVDEGASVDFTEVIEATSKKGPGTDSVSRNAIQELRQSRPESGAQLEEIMVSGSKAAVSDAAARPCNEEQTADPESWWQCIAELEKAGRHDEAAAELDMLRAAHPDFEAPATLPSQ
jgi:hypothetical protein